jgi:pimeloyl-ACP methyl ester carboxylesterase
MMQRLNDARATAQGGRLMLLRLLHMLVLSLSVLLLLGTGTAAPQTSSATVVASISEHHLQVGEQKFRYLRAGSRGTPIVLLHGWPQSADQWRRVMTLLASDHIVIAPDLRGIGGTSAPTKDWRKEALARDIHAFIRSLKIESPVIAGHDIGGMVAYAYARLFPSTASGVAILDVPIPGLAPWDAIASSPHAWHFDFHAQVPLAEALVSGRQATYFRYFINRVGKHPAAISDEAVRTYAAAYGSPERLSAGFGFYRAFPADSAFFASQRDRLDLPLLLVAADNSLGAGLQALAESLRGHGAQDLRSVVVPDSGHWVAEEQPRATADALARFAAEVTKR